MIKQKKREELYDMFRQGAIPSGADFADLIKSQLNLLDDGLKISENADDPIGLRGHGEGENYLDLADAQGANQWRLSGYDEALTTKGLNLTANEQSKLFIERETGNVGINTDEPKAKLHLVQISATDALRIDDKGSDETPLIVTAEGQVGLGTPSPAAKLHLSHSGSGAILRVDDTDDDNTPFIIDDNGNVGIGYEDPQAKLTVAGGMVVGANLKRGNGLYVAGNFEVTGTAVFSGDEAVGGIEINAPLSSKTNVVTIRDNVNITGDGRPDGSQGNLSVAGNTTLGKYRKNQDQWNVLTVNGRIRAGGDLELGEEQYPLELNDIFTVNRDPANRQAKLEGALTVEGNAVLGSNQDDNIYLNGVVSSQVDGGVVLDADLRITGNTVVGNAQSDLISLNGTIRSAADAVLIDDNLVVTESTTLGNAPSDQIHLNGTVSSDSGKVVIDDNLQVTGTVVLGDSQNEQIRLNGTISSTVGNVKIEDNLEVTQTATLNALNLSSGATVNKISADPALAGNSNAALPTEQAVKAYIDNLLVGSIAAFATTVVPPGWLECNGQPVSRTQYERLYKLIGLTYGAGDGFNTFNLPNLRNRFLRGFDPDTGRMVGTKENAATGSHEHTFTSKEATISGGDHVHVVNSGLRGQRALCGFEVIHRTGYLRLTGQWGNYLLYNQNGASMSATHTHKFTPTGNIEGVKGEEPRPLNTAVMFCIKY